MCSVSDYSVSALDHSMINRKSQLSKGSIGVYLALVLSACTAIDIHREPPKDWPDLTVGVRKLGFWELQTACGGGGLTFLATQYLACAYINFNDMTCTIYYAADDESGIMAIEHEEMHCLGHDHIGSSLLSDAWATWKSQNRRAGK